MPDEKPKCGARTRAGGVCRRPAGWGTDHLGAGRCSSHTGSTRNGRKAAQKEIARQEVARFALPREVDPSVALLEEVHRTAGWVAWLTARVEERVTELGDVKALFQTTASDRRASEWVQLLADERKHLAAVTSAAIRAGIEERRVRLAEQQGDLLAGVIRAILDDLGLSREQRALVPEVVPRHLRSLTA